MRPGGNSHPVPRYNNKTYRVDEIDFTMNCLRTFVDHNRVERTFIRVARG